LQLTSLVRRSVRPGAIVLAAAVVVAACGGAATPSSASPSGAAASSAAGLPNPGATSVTLQGAGATFPAPLYQTWFDAFTGKYASVQFNYQSNGSGAGIKAITEQTVDFGASDAPMKDDEIKALAAGAKLLHIPTALGAVVAIYNIPGITDLNLDGDTLAGIYLGTITKWNDPKIAALNTGATLPALDIQVVHRADGSGTTNAFTTYLDTVSPDWHSKIGAGKSVNWPVGIGSPGNDGVAGAVKNLPSQTVGAIGYVELTYATSAGLSSAKLKNAAGTFVAGSTDGVTAAAEAALANFPADFRQKPIINGAGDTSYPIASYTYLLVPTDWKDAGKAQAIVAFLAWALNDGQGLEKDLGYAPLPTTIRDKALTEVHLITANGAPVWP